MINDDDLRAMRDNALAAWALTIGIIVVVSVIVSIL
jgi:heme/copper-type cytochrome/quinol oxidase subunit 1